MRTFGWFMIVMVLALPLGAGEANPAAARSGGNLLPGPATVAGDFVNVRGLPSLNGEVLQRLSRDQAVTVVEVVTAANPKAGEPAQWAAIHPPPNTPAWVFAQFVDATNKTVTVTRLNVRGGPGENYSVIARLKKGETFTEVELKGEWIRILPPPDGLVYVAAEYLQQAVPPPQPVAETPGSPATTHDLPVTTEPAPAAALTVPAPTTNAPVAPAPEPSTPASAPTNTVPEAAPALLAEAAIPPTTVPEPAPQPPTNAPPRIVTREGFVRATLSIQAPSEWELADVRHRRTIAFLRPASPDFKLIQFWDKRVMVTGKESVDSRWPKVPILTIEKIELPDE